MTIAYKRINVYDQQIFYREAGSVDSPVLLLLHGFPSSSHMFRNLIPLLEQKFHIIAPDYVGFGQSTAPDSHTFHYTFDNLTRHLSEMLVKMNIQSFFMYVFDYGAPIGFRLALNNPNMIKGIITQNGNIYEEGLGDKWKVRKRFWSNPTVEKRDTFKDAFSRKTIINQYTFGEKKNSVSPDGYELDIHYTHSSDYAERQLDLIYDYHTNVALYPEFQKYIRQYQPKILVMWGENDLSFIPKGALAFQKDSKHCKIILLEAGHFALETQYPIIAKEILKNFA